MATRLLVALALLLGTDAARANDTAIWGVGGAIRPMEEHSSIVMEKMDLRIDIYRETGRAECHYVFHNTGPATTVRMGFPETVTGSLAGRPRGFLSFATSVDGRVIPARIEGGLVEGPVDTSRWRVKTVHFGAGQRRRVRVSYTSELGVTLGNKKWRVFNYKIETGASWKGPIGSVRVRVFGHYDPNRNWLEVDPRFRQTGPASFEWGAQNLEPTQGLAFHLYRDDIALTFGGSEDQLYHYLSTYAYIREGEAWVQTRTAATALRAKVETRDGEVVLTRGACVVRLRPGTPVMSRNGGRETLPEAPYVRDGHLMVPLRPVAVALGAEVTFDARRHLTDLSFGELQEPMYRELLDYTVWHPQLRGYAPPERSEFDPALTADTPRPWVCTGDFDGNGARDAVFLLRRGDEVRVVALVRPEKDWKLLWLAYWEHVPAQPGGLRTGLRLLKSGQVVGWTPTEAGQPMGQLTLAHDGVELATPGRPTVLYYWDAKLRELRSGTIPPPPVAEGERP